MKCTKCEIEKPRDQFGSSGYSPCKSCAAIYTKKRYGEKGHLLRAEASLWRKANPEKTRQYTAKYKAANKDLVAKDAKAYRTKPHAKQQARINTRNRRAIKRNASGVFIAADIDTLYASQQGLCTICHAKLSATGYHIDHMVPLIMGGSNWPINLQLLCPPCNLRKHTRAQLVPIPKG